MNEEELKKGCGKELKKKAFENPSLSLYCGIEVFVSESVGLKVILCPTCKAKLEYFQKGKLEIIEEEIKFLKEFKRGQQKWLTYQLIKLIDRINYLEKQLQKEIGEEKQDE